MIRYGQSAAGFLDNVRGRYFIDLQPLSVCVSHGPSNVLSTIIILLHSAALLLPRCLCVSGCLGLCVCVCVVHLAYEVVVRVLWLNPPVFLGK